MKLSVIISFLVLSSVEPILAQNAYFRLGKQAYVDADFKMAVAQLEKACLLDSTNSTALFMLGYSYYHNGNYAKSINTFSKQLAITPTEGSAYYYRARAKVYLGKDGQLSPAEREKYLLGALYDFTKAITVNPGDDKLISYYQNRGIAYRDYAIFKLSGMRNFDKLRIINSLKNSIADFEKILASDPSRSDIVAQLDLSKEKLAGVTGHH